MALDFAARLLIDLYAQRRDPNNPEIAMRAAIDVYDLAKIIVEQDAEISRLRELVQHPELIISEAIHDATRSNNGSRG